MKNGIALFWTAQLLLLLLLTAAVNEEEADNYPTCDATTGRSSDGRAECIPSSSDEARPTSHSSGGINASKKAPKNNGKKKKKKSKWIEGRLRPTDLPGPEVFSDFHTNSSLTLPSGAVVRYADGSVVQINRLVSDDGHGDASSASSGRGASAEVSVIEGAIPRPDAESIVDIMRGMELHELDSDPDTVDGMPTYEMFVETHDMDPSHPTNKVRDTDPASLQQRNALRAKLKNITQPLLEDVITPFVRAKHPGVCDRPDDEGGSRKCTPCYSLIRRYRHGERQSHEIHHDAHAIVTVVVSLSDYGRDYMGGLYVSTGHGQRQFLSLRSGDAAVHQSTLLHGVKVLDLPDRPADTERWSWILWYRDSTTCQDHSAEWFADCALTGHIICQQLHADKVGDAEEKVRLNVMAAEGGSGQSAVKIARAYLGTLPSPLPFDLDQAKRYFQIAIRSYNPDGHYGMASILIVEAHGAGDAAKQHSVLAKAVGHLERAAHAEHAYGMFNLGIAHIYGYGMPNGRVDMELGAEWCVRSGLPEGYFVASQYAASAGDQERYELWGKRALMLGHSQPWRKQAREHTGSGGAGGVSLNLKWPPSPHRDGMVPPEF